MNKEIILSENQKNIVSDLSDFLIVKAGPGAGKTETLSKYIIEQSLIVPKFKVNLVSSYTKVGTNEIRDRVRKHNSELESTIFKTFDNFLNNDLWFFYLNRICEYIHKKLNISYSKNNFYKIDKILYSQNINGKLYKFWDLKKELETEGENRNNIIKWWLSELKSNNFQAGLISDYILFKYIKNNDQIKMHIKSKINRIIIDEAQDLNCLRINIILYMFSNLNIKITIVGDQNQTLFEFNGAVKKSFDEIESILKNNNIASVKVIGLDNNYRIDKDKQLLINVVESINLIDKLGFKNNIQRLYSESEIINDRTNFQIKVDDFILKNNNQKMIILCETNVQIKKIKDILDLTSQKDINFSLRIDGKFYNEMTIYQIEFIESFATYQLMKKDNNFRKRVRINPVETIIDNLFGNFQDKETKFINFFSTESEERLINNINKMLGININELYNIYINEPNFLTTLKQNKVSVMTVHGSKGLEAN
ncbi:MAG: ATP-dependent helicase, partial [Mycoplasmataceae bacterium]|nr:ATP-dependent helicase [Mycoplasmataceae bacterium]